MIAKSHRHRNFYGVAGGTKLKNKINFKKCMYQWGAVTFQSWDAVQKRTLQFLECYIIFLLLFVNCTDKCSIFRYFPNLTLNLLRYDMKILLEF